MTISRRNVIKAATIGSLSSFPIFNRASAEDASVDIQHGSRINKAIALTFHGAGSPYYANQLLKLFKVTSTQISVFAVGTWLANEPLIAKRILDEGHDLGNHTMTHTQMKTISAQRVDSEIAGCAAELKKIIGNQGSWFRPSGTQFSTPLIRAAAKKYGYGNCISYEVDSHDFQDPTTKVMIKNVMENVKNGSIISLHFGHKVTLDAMPTLLDHLHSKGLKPVTLTELLKT